jgi:hypothetical protein
MENDFLDYIFTNLKVISRIEENGKVCVRNGNLHLETNYFQVVSRWLYSDTRESTLRFIKNIISCCISASKNIILYDKSQTIPKHQLITLERIKNSLVLSKKGLVNIKVTYKDDITIQSSIEVIIEKIDLHVKEIDEVIVKYSPEEQADDTDGE